MLRSEVRTATIGINEIYPTIQGEGLLVGTPSLFIRIQGCNLRCPWCDQPSALSFKEERKSLEELLNIISSYPHRHVVITGGEPFTEENLHLLVKELLKMGKSVQIETNGTLWQEGLEEVANLIHITCSPKAVASWYIRSEIRKYAKELKFVVDEELELKDLLRFEDFLKRSCVVLQPEGNKERFVKKALELQDRLLSLGYEVRVIPQLHKFLGLK
jgi:organic radical activating enzyme